MKRWKKVVPKSLTFFTPPPTFQLRRDVRFWFFVTLKYHIWTAKKCIVRQSMCTQTAHRVPTTENSFNFFHFLKISVCVPHVCTYIVSLYIFQWSIYGTLMPQNIRNVHHFKVGKQGGQKNPAFWPPFGILAKNMDIFRIFKNHLMSRFDISS